MARGELHFQATVVALSKPAGKDSPLRLKGRCRPLNRRSGLWQVDLGSGHLEAAKE